MRKSIVLSTVVLLAILGISIATAYDPMYYKPIYINNTGGEEQTYYQVLLNVTYESDMQTDFDDLRVKYYNGAEWVFIPYWVEKKVDGEWCKLWFNATSIPANSWCNNSYRLYYGDDAATSESNTSTTFIREIDKLRAAWNFDEREGNIVHDSSGNDNDGTIYGATWADGKYGGALKFDALDEYVIVPDNDTLDLVNSGAIEVWINFTGNPFGGGFIVSKAYTDTNPKQYIFRETLYNGLSTRFAWDGDTSYSFLDIGQDLQFNTWYHIVETQNTTYFSTSWERGYINGTEVASKGDPNGFVPNDMSLYIGYWSYYEANGVVNGIIDVVRIYGDHLTPEEISDLYNYYGYTTENYPGRVLVKKWSDPEPTTSLGASELANPSSVVTTMSPLNVQSNSLTFRGWLNCTPANVSFSWGTENGGYVFKTPSQYMTEIGSFTYNLKSPILFANKNYKYRAEAVFEGTTYYGEDYVFTMGDADIPDIVKNNTFSESYNMINYTNLTTEAFALAILNVWTSVWGSFFWVLICGFPFILMYITQHNTTIPGVLAMILGGTMLIYLPPEWQSVAYSLLIVAVAGIMVGIFKSKK